MPPAWIILKKTYTKRTFGTKKVFSTGATFLSSSYIKFRNTYTYHKHGTFSSASKPDASTLTPSIAKQQVYPCLGKALFSFAQERTHWGPTQQTN